MEEKPVLIKAKLKWMEGSAPRDKMYLIPLENIACFQYISNKTYKVILKKDSKVEWGFSNFTFELETIIEDSQFQIVGLNK
jgi:hypothetical protein